MPLSLHYPPFLLFHIWPSLSKFGRHANTIDAAAQRQTYPVGGPPLGPSIPLKNSQLYDSNCSLVLSSWTVCRPFSYATEFFSTLDIFWSTLGVSSREIIPQFDLYFKHIHSLDHSLGNSCLWTGVVQYDAEVCTHFCIQPCIGWDEWNHPLLDGYKSCILFGPNCSSCQP